MCHTVLNIGDLDLDLQGQIDLQTYKKFYFNCETLNDFKFYLPTWTVYQESKCLRKV